MPTPPTVPISLTDNLATLSYERARDELVDVVRQLESGTASLAESMELWQLGEKLAGHCQNLLEAARTTVAQQMAEASPAAPSAEEADEAV